MIRIIWEIIRLVFLHKMHIYGIKEGNHFLLPVTAEPACMHVLLVPFVIKTMHIFYNEPVYIT
jgi:hypothetical protein